MTALHNATILRAQIRLELSFSFDPGLEERIWSGAYQGR